MNTTQKRIRLFPSPTGVNHYEFERYALKKLLDLEFPSPTGVNHYESLPIKP